MSSQAYGERAGGVDDVSRIMGGSTWPRVNIVAPPLFIAAAPPFSFDIEHRSTFPMNFRSMTQA